MSEVGLSEEESSGKWLDKLSSRYSEMEWVDP